MAREAVIVGSLRTGLTKAHRGSFNLTEPVDYTAHVMREVVNEQPNLDKAEIEDVILGCGHPGGLHGHEHGPHRLDGGRHSADRRSDDGQPLLLVGLAGRHDGGERDPPGRRRGRGRRGRRDDHDDAGRDAEPDPAREQDGGRALPRSLLTRWASRPRCVAERYKHRARGSGRLRAPEPAALRRGRREGLDRRGDLADEGDPQGHSPRTREEYEEEFVVDEGRVQPTAPPPSKGCRSSKPVFKPAKRRAERSPRATPPSSPTAPRRRC